MNQEEILNNLFRWFEKRGCAMERLDLNQAIYYLELGLIDSMGLMELITELEQAHHIRFNENHFQDPRFLTLQGLAELIAQLQES